MSDPQTAILALDRVSKSFGTAPFKVNAAQSVSFEMHAGRTLALVGESGSGKTTCARLVMREYMPSEGSQIESEASKQKGHMHLPSRRGLVSPVPACAIPI